MMASVKKAEMLEYKYDTQLLIEGDGLDEDAVNAISRQTSRGTPFWPWAIKS